MKTSLKRLQQYLFDLEGAYYVGKDGHSRYGQSVHGCGYSRLEKAKQQASLKPVPVEKVNDLVVAFLKEIGIHSMPLKIDSSDIAAIDYEKIAIEYGLKKEADIIWIKLASNGAVGVVCASDDVNLQMPSCPEDYDAKSPNGDWLYNTAGIILHKLGMTWQPFVIIFPLPGIPKGYRRGDIEQAVGNMLIEAEVPIIDYYSHCY